MPVHFVKGISLKEKLSCYTKENLKIIADNLECSKIYKLNKAELVDLITETFLNPEKFFFYASVLDDRMIELIEKGTEGPVQISQQNFERVHYLNQMHFVVVSRDQYISLSDVTESLHKIRTHEFEQYRKRASWVWKCLKFTEDYYAYTPIENLLDVINTKKGIKMKAPELYSIFDHFPLEYSLTIRFDDIFLEETYADDMEALMNLRTRQADKEFYVPTVSEIEEYYETLALLSDQSYQNMARFLKTELIEDDAKLHEILLDLYTELSFTDDPNETLQWFVNQFEIEDQAQAERLVNCYMQVANETRTQMNRGYKPIEIHLKYQSKMPPKSMPVIHAGSTLAAELLSQAAPEIQKMGFKVDLDSNAAMFPLANADDLGSHGVVKKVYPNDPCPCGSGKKFKKCCGKNY